MSDQRSQLGSCSRRGEGRVRKVSSLTLGGLARYLEAIATLAWAWGNGGDSFAIAN